MDPQGFFLSHEVAKPLYKYRVEGIGFEFAPKNLDIDIVDKWIKTEDKESFRMAKRIIKEEGLMIGGSSGSVLCAALKIGARFTQRQGSCRIVYRWNKKLLN